MRPTRHQVVARTHTLSFSIIVIVAFRSHQVACVFLCARHSSGSVQSSNQSPTFSLRYVELGQNVGGANGTGKKMTNARGNFKFFTFYVFISFRPSSELEVCARFFFQSRLILGYNRKIVSSAHTHIIVNWCVFFSGN